MPNAIDSSRNSENKNANYKIHLFARNNKNFFKSKLYGFVAFKKSYQKHICDKNFIVS